MKVIWWSKGCSWYSSEHSVIVLVLFFILKYFSNCATKPIICPSFLSSCSNSSEKVCDSVSQNFVLSLSNFLLIISEHLDLESNFSYNFHTQSYLKNLFELVNIEFDDTFYFIALLINTTIFWSRSIIFFGFNFWKFRLFLMIAYLTFFCT